VVRFVGASTEPRRRGLLTVLPGAPSHSRPTICELIGDAARARSVGRSQVGGLGGHRAVRRPWAAHLVDAWKVTDQFATKLIAMTCTLVEDTMQAAHREIRTSLIPGLMDAAKLAVVRATPAGRKVCVGQPQQWFLKPQWGHFHRVPIGS